MTTLKQKVLRSSSREKAKSLHRAVAKSSKPASTSNLLISQSSQIPRGISLFCCRYAKTIS